MSNPASGLIDGVQRITYKFENTMNAIPSIGRKADTSWHDEMVKKANESFRKAAEDSAKRRKAKGRVAGAAASTPKKTAKKKTAARKRLAIKR